MDSSIFDNMVKPNVLYKNLITEINYENDYYTDKPIVSLQGGEFSLSFNQPHCDVCDITINKDTGVIYFNKTLSSDEYNFNIVYNINDISIILDYKLIVIPVVIYNSTNIVINYSDLSEITIIYQSDIPIIKDVNGIFSINQDVSKNNIYSIEIDKITGLISILSPDTLLHVNKINYIGIFNFEVHYKKNNSINKIIFNLIVNPIIKYNTNNNILYNSLHQSEKPEIIPNMDSLFRIDDNLHGIIIDNFSGMIYFNNCLPVESYTIPIIFIGNNTHVNLEYKFNIIPIFYYEKNNLNIQSNLSFLSDLPIVNPKDGMFYIEESENYIDKNSGIINFAKLDVGKHNLKIDYILNNITTSFILNINILPYISYQYDLHLLDFGTYLYSDPPLISNQGGLFSLDEFQNQDIEIDSITGIINFIKNKKYGLIKLNINYQLNELNYNTNYIIEFRPTIKYIINFIGIEECTYNLYSDEPLVSHPGGTFYLKDTNTGIKIDPNTGILEFAFINISNIKLFKILVYYVLSTINISDTAATTEYEVYTDYNIKINLVLNYNPNKLLIIYNSSELIHTYSVAPDININGGYFYCDNLPNNVILNKTTGIITVYNNIDINLYELEIKYNITDITTQKFSEVNIKYYIEVNEMLYYDPPNINILYSTEQIAIPSVKSNGIFNVFYEEALDQSQSLLAHNISFDTCTGIININDHIVSDISNIDNFANVGNYNLYISYTNSITKLVCNTNYLITISPYLKYNNTNININYGLYFKSDKPICKPLGGIFTFTNTNKNIIINKINGIVLFSNLYVGNCNFDIIYTKCNISTSINYTININPSIKYLSNKLNESFILYGTEFNSDAPELLPESPLEFNLILQNAPIGVKINNKGIINFSSTVPVGSYEIRVIYTVNKINISTTYNLIISATIKYEILDNYNAIINYKNPINLSKSPIVNYPNGIFSLQYSPLIKWMDKITINKNTGIITIYQPQDVSNLLPDEYNFNVYYTINNLSCSTIYTLKVEPYIEYINNIKIKYKNIFESELPIVKPEGGRFYLLEFTNESVTCDIDKGILTIDDKLDIDNYVYKINYIFNNISTYFDYCFTIIPNTYYDPVELFYNESIIHKPKNNDYNGIFENPILCSEKKNINLEITKNGNLIIENIPIGKFKFIINYVVNGKVIIGLPFDLNIKPNVEYIQNNFITFKNKFELQPIIDDIQGIFELQFINEEILINSRTGTIYCTEYLLPNIYNLKIQFMYEDEIIYLTTKITVLSEFYYPENNIIFTINQPQKEINSCSPILNPVGGLFTIHSDLDIIISSSGILTMTDLDIGIYNLLINYNYLAHSLITTTIYKFTLQPFFSYKKNFTELQYSDVAISDQPDIYPYGGIFSIINITNITNITNNEIYGININTNTGILTFQNINIGLYELNIQYQFNNISVIVNYNLNIYPYIKLTTNNFEIEYGNKYLITKPIVGPASGIFSLEGNINENIILNNDGSIELLSELNINNYTIELFYQAHLNYDSKLSVIYNFKVKPHINYDISNIIITCEDVVNSCRPVVNSERPMIDNGFFKIQNMDNMSIEKRTGILLFAKLNIGFYNIIVEYNYIIGKMYNTVTTEYKLQVIPKFYYDENKVIEYLKNDYSIKPYVNPPGLQFYCDNLEDGITLDINTGILNMSHCLVGNYNFKIYYQAFSTNYNLIVKPNLTYIDLSGGANPCANITELKLNYGINYILYADCLPLNGEFAGDIPSNIKLDNNGNLCIPNNLEPNNYIFDIIYSVNNVSTTYTINIIINSIINYPKLNTIINGKSISDSGYPIVMPKRGKFSSDNLPIDASLDINTGLINFNNVNIGNYNFDILYTFNTIINTISYNLLVNPIFYYPENIVHPLIKKIKFNTSDKSEIPITSELCSSIFELKTKINNVILNKKTGEIIFNDCIEIGTYSLIINLSDTQQNNNIIVTTIYNFEVVPILYYNTFILNYNENITRIPFVNPKNGVFKLVNKIDGVIINDDGIINVSNLNVEIYNISVKYSYNAIEIEYPITIIVNPIIKYNNFNFQVSHNNGLITSDSDIIKIDNNYNLLINNYIIGSHIISFNYNVNNVIQKIKLKVNILPKIIYKLKDNQLVPELNVNNDGYFECNNLIENSYIDNQSGIINFDKKIVGKFNLNIKYSNNNIEKIINYELVNKPIIIYEENNLTIIYNITEVYYSVIPTLYPLNGIIFLKSKYKGISILNNGQLKFINVDPDIYNIIVEYKYNDISEFINYNLIVKPFIEYKNNEINVNHKSFHIIDKPIVNPTNGKFSCSSTIFIINNDGQILIPDNIKYGKYNLNIMYDLNQQINMCDFYINIISLFNYSESKLIIDYGDNKQSVKPLVSEENGIFYFENQFTETISIDSKSGILNFNKVDVGEYKLKIIYLIDEIKLDTLYTLLVNPIFKYNDNNRIIIYQNNLTFKSELPVVHPSDGLFSLFCTSEIYMVNSQTGEISTDNLKVGNYNYLIKYNIKDINLQIEYKLKVIPTIFYEIKSVNLTFGIKYKFDKAIINPSGGHFICYSLPVGCIINESTGEIYISKYKNVSVGAYNLIINYILNNISSSTNIFINIIE
jgi:hypothetical protein